MSPAAYVFLAVILFVIGGAAMMVPRFTQRAAATLGAWVVLLVLTLYLAIMLSQLDVEGVNYFGDTLMFAGVLLVTSFARLPRDSVRR